MAPAMVRTLAVVPRICHQHYSQGYRAAASCSVQTASVTNVLSSKCLSRSNHRTMLDSVSRKRCLSLNTVCYSGFGSSLTSSVHTLSYKVDRYQGVHCDLGDVPDYVTAEEFEVVLRASMKHWKNSGKCAIWLQVPIVMGQVIPVAAKYGFEYHHAEGDIAVLSLWLRKNVPNKLPPYATHQVGVSGVVLKEETSEVLVVKDRNRPFTLWKFPGGLADLGEDIAQTAEREIKEETGLTTEFCGVLAFRQQHDHPNAFGRSDLFFVCHMHPLSFELVPCVDEIEDAKWIHIEELAKNKQTSAITQRIIRLMRIGMERGFNHVDLKADEFQSVYKGLKFKMYNKWLPKDNKEHQYSHSMASPEQLWNQK